MLAYPLDIIKTNRILQTPLAREGAERIPREILSLQERGNLYRGLYRGYMLAAIYGVVVSKFANSGFNEQAGVAGVLMGSFLANPLQVLTVRRQVITQSHDIKPYKDSFKELMKGSRIRPFTLGVIPTMIRNTILALGFQPALNGFNQTSVSLLYALGGILLSHPFEVARVHLQTQESSSTFGHSFKMMRGIYAIEGLGGLYRGAVPRVIALLPVMAAASAHASFNIK